MTDKTLEQMTKANQQERSAQLFELMIDRFLQRYRPIDRYDAREFERDLHSLVRQIYMDAQQPILEQLGRIAAHSSLESLLRGPNAPNR